MKADEVYAKLKKMIGLVSVGINNTTSTQNPDGSVTITINFTSGSPLSFTMAPVKGDKGVGIKDVQIKEIQNGENKEYHLILIDDKDNNIDAGNIPIPDITNLATKSDLTTHTSDTNIHITTAERNKWNEIDNISQALKTTQSIEYGGKSITCENTLASRTSDMLIKGQTYQNLVNSINSGLGCTIDDFINIRGTEDKVWAICDIKVKPQLSSNKIYTVIYNCINKSGYFEFTGFDSNLKWQLKAKVEKTGINKFLISNKDVSFVRIQTNETDASIKIDKNIIILEGDWTNKELPASITGIESVGQKEGKINILSNNKSEDDANYKQDKKEILLQVDGGLKSLPNGTADTIEQRNDGVYLVQRVGKVVLNGSETWGKSSWSMTNTFKFDFEIGLVAKLFDTSATNQILCDTFKVVSRNSLDNVANREFESVCPSNSRSRTLSITISKTKLNNTNTTGVFKQWLSNNPVTVYYELETPVETKLNINNLDLEVYKGTTYIKTDNAIQATLSFKVPSNIGGIIQTNSQNINELYKLIDEVIIPQLINNSADIEVLKLK